MAVKAKSKKSSKAAKSKAPAQKTNKKAAKIKKPTKESKSAKKIEAKSTLKASAKKEAPKKEIPRTAAEKASDKRRSQANAAMKAAMDESPTTESTEEEEFDPSAFFAASGGQGIFRAHVMRKERVDFNLVVRYRFLTGPLVYNAELLNLSKGGLCLKTPSVVKPKTVIKIEIPLPHTSELFTVQAECVWSDPLPNQKGEQKASNTGLKFLVMSLAKQTVINNFIQQRRDELIMAKIGLDKFTDSVPVAGLD